MKYTTILGLGLAIAKRDPAPYKDVIDNISRDVASLEFAVNAYSGDDEKPVVDASNTLVKAIKDGKAKIDSMGDITPSDALPLSGSLQTLNANSQNLTSSLKDKRQVIERADQCGAVRSAIGNISISSHALVDSAISKVPKPVQPIAQRFASDFTQSFSETQDYFSESNCKNGDGANHEPHGTPGSETSSPSASSTSTTPASQAATSSQSSSACFRPSPSWALSMVMVMLNMYF